MSAGQPNNSQVTATPAKRGRFAFWRHGMREPVCALIATTVVVYAGSIIAYVFRFGAQASNKQAHWGQFGDFVGGLVNPTIGLATVALLFMAYRLQRRELRLSQLELARSARALTRQARHIEAKAKLDDIQRAIEGAYRQWEMAGEVPYRGIIGHDGKEPVAINDARLPDMTRISAATSERTQAWMIKALSLANRGFFKAHWQKNFLPLVLLLREIADYLDRYDSIADGRALTDFYRRRLHRAAVTIGMLGILDMNIVARLNAGDEAQVEGGVDSNGVPPGA